MLGFLIGLLVGAGVAELFARNRIKAVNEGWDATHKRHMAFLTEAEARGVIAGDGTWLVDRKDWC